MNKGKIEKKKLKDMMNDLLMNIVSLNNKANELIKKIKLLKNYGVSEIKVLRYVDGINPDYYSEEKLDEYVAYVKELECFIEKLEKQYNELLKNVQKQKEKEKTKEKNGGGRKKSSSI